MYQAASASPQPTAADPAATIAVTVDPRRDLVTYTIAGFLDEEGVKSLADGQAKAAAALRCAPNRHLTIIDITGAKLQSQSVIELFRAMLADPRYLSRRLAVVVGGSLARMQIRRVLDRDTVTYVATLAEAEAALFG